VGVDAGTDIRAKGEGTGTVDHRKKKSKNTDNKQKQRALKSVQLGDAHGSGETSKAMGEQQKRTQRNATHKRQKQPSLESNIRLRLNNEVQLRSSHFFLSQHSPNAGTVQTTSTSPYIQRIFQGPTSLLACRSLPSISPCHDLGTTHLSLVKLVPGGGHVRDLFGWGWTGCSLLCSQAENRVENLCVFHFG